MSHFPNRISRWLTSAIHCLSWLVFLLPWVLVSSGTGDMGFLLQNLAHQRCFSSLKHMASHYVAEPVQVVPRLDQIGKLTTWINWDSSVLGSHALTSSARQPFIDIYLEFHVFYNYRVARSQISHEYDLGCIDSDYSSSFRQNQPIASNCTQYCNRDQIKLKIRPL